MKEQEDFQETICLFGGEKIYSTKECVDLLFPFVDSLIEEYENKRLPEEDDWRSGDETYGYDKDDFLVLSYICGKWNCAFRIRWIIDLVTPDYYPYKSLVDKDYKPIKRVFK